MISYIGPIALTVKDTVVVGGAFASLILILFIVFFCLLLKIIAWAGMWKSASKAGQIGILACIPIVQLFIWSIMAEKPTWWGLLFLIPIVNLVIMAIVFYEISVRFGRGIGTTIGLILLPFIFWPILGFGSAEYHKA